MVELYSKQPLDKIAKIVRGKFSARPRNDPQYYGGSIPFLQTGDIARAESKICDWSQTLNEKGLAVSKLFPRNTIFMSIAANIGDVAISGFDAACPDSVVAFFPNVGTNKEWLFQTLRSAKFGLSKLATQNAQANLSLEKIGPYRVPLPPLPEQRKIAEIFAHGMRGCKPSPPCATLCWNEETPFVQRCLPKLAHSQKKLFSAISWQKAASPAQMELQREKFRSSSMARVL